MICTKCGKEMRKGYLFASKDGAFSFANEVPGVFEKADKADGFVEITSLKPGHRTSIAAECCEECLYAGNWDIRSIHISCFLIFVRKLLQKIYLYGEKQMKSISHSFFFGWGG